MSATITTAEIINNITTKILDDAKNCIRPQVIINEIDTDWMVCEIYKDKDMRYFFEKPKPWYEGSRQELNDCLCMDTKICYILARYPYLLKSFICDYYEFSRPYNTKKIYDTILEAEKLVPEIKPAIPEQICEICDRKDFDNLHNYTIHVQACAKKAMKPVKPDSYTCSHCDKIYTSEAPYNKHIKICEIKTAAKKAKATIVHICQICNKEYTSEVPYNKHVAKCKPKPANILYDNKPISE